VYGYIRPNKGELKIREYESFRTVYCGLCHCLRRRYGLAARFILSYDITFLSMLLIGSEKVCKEQRRCPASPFRRRTCLASTPALDAAADYSVILSYWKLRDTVHDEGFIRSLPARLGLLLLSGAYRRAARRAPEFDRQAKENLEGLSELERSRCPSLDRTADRFASMLQGAAGQGDGERERILSQLFYHIGRTVYILDAVDDLAEDVRRKRYNPLLYRFPQSHGGLSEAEREELRVTLQHSGNMIAAAFQLLEPGPWSGILENTVYLGLPQVTQLVLSGEWKNRRRTVCQPPNRLNGVE